MALKLNTRELPAVTFTRKLPEFLGPGGVDCFITVEAKAGGAVNPEYMLAMERLRVARDVSARALEKVEDDTAFVEKQRSDAEDMGKIMFGAIYDACITRWETNVCSDGKPIEATRENFLELATAPVQAIGAAMLDLQAAIIKAGNGLANADAKLIKN